jgi:transposase-like protein
MRASPGAARGAHEGLKNAIAKILGAPWQRCTAHFLRDCLGYARRDQHGLLAALIRPTFNVENLAAARDKLSEAVAALEGTLPKVAGVLEDAEDDILGLLCLPGRPLAQDQRHHPLERFNCEIGWRTDVVRIFPNDRSPIRLASMLAIEQNDEWLVGRYLTAESMGPLREQRPIEQTTRRSSSSNRSEHPPR